MAQRYCVLFVVLCFGYVVSIVWPSVLGDASIYEVFWSGFFHKPFSFAHGEVAFGATSPWHVIAMALPWHVGGLALVKGAAFAMIAAVSLCLERRFSRDGSCYGILLLGVACFPILLQSVAQGFESAWVCLWGFAVLAVLYSKSGFHWYQVVLLSLGPLIRPELVLVMVPGVAMLDCQLRKKLYLLGLCLMLLLLYHAYMLINGAGILPSSIWERALRTAGEHDLWSEKWRDAVSLSTRYSAASFVVYLVGVLLWLLALYRWYRVRRTLMPLLVMLPVLLLYVAFPPGQYLTRYLIPVIPVMAVCVLWWLERVSFRFVKPLFVVVAGVLLVFSYHQERDSYSKYSRSIWMLEDLSSVLNQFMEPDDGILLYEVQGQLNLKGKVISADGVVGNEMRHYLLREEGFGSVVEREGIDWIVTMNSFNYRSLFDDSELLDLYSFDLQAPIGARIDLGGWTWEKVLSNPAFSDSRLYKIMPVDGLNRGEAMRVFGGMYPKWEGHTILWNSVFKRVED